MAAATTTSRTPPPGGRSPPNYASRTASTLAKGATARSAAAAPSTKANAALNGQRRPSVRVVPSDPGPSSSEMEFMANALKRETEEKEALLVRIQDMEQTMTSLMREDDGVKSELHAAEERLTEFYASQSRMEDEMAARLDLVDRLRAQIHELERDNRDVTKRYNEQTATFEAERQSFYDNEQHLKSRIQSLVQARTAPSIASSPTRDNDDDDGFTDVEDDVSEQELHQKTPTDQKFNSSEDDEPAEMTSLRLELSTLSTSYTSLQTTVQHLSHQLLDLRRMNKILQEENESYNILLRERTLNGQYDILRTVGTANSDYESSGEESDDRDDTHSRGERESTRSIQLSSLDPVDEMAEELDDEDEMSDQEDSSERLDEDEDVREDSESSPSKHNRDRAARRYGRTRRAASRSRSPATKGETLADLPITGPGLDLAAELGRAENLAILEGRMDAVDVRDRSVLNGKSKRKKVELLEIPGGTTKTEQHVGEGGDIDALRNEVKSLKDANKALSLYASKIIDRIIAQEGFEHVLSIDYDKSSNPNSPTKPKSSPPGNVEFSAPPPEKKARPQSAIFGRPFTSSTTSSSPDPSIPASPPLPAESTSTSKAQRRSMSFDWKSFSVFGGTEKRPESGANLRPLTLRPGGPSAVSGRKLETHEDEDDRRERERMNATLKLMGIEKHESPLLPVSPMMNGMASPGLMSSPPLTSSPDPSINSSNPKPTAPSRFSFFRSRSSTTDGGSSIHSSIHSPQSSHNGSITNLPSNLNLSNLTNLTKEALEAAEVEADLAALDAKEKTLSDEIARGGASGFTELPRRQTMEERRSKRSGKSAGSSSTIWSLGGHE